MRLWRWLTSPWRRRAERSRRMADLVGSLTEAVAEVRDTRRLLRTNHQEGDE